jgi:oxalate decarboxylase/phosphoglucose isomerase-like protein (cupin superfamily)
MNAPFGSAYCIVAPHTNSLQHINEPSDEEELFVCVKGSAEVVIDNEPYSVGPGDVVFIPRGKSHYVKNATDDPFHFYAIWWNTQGSRKFLQTAAQSATPGEDVEPATRPLERSHA